MSRWYKLGGKDGHEIIPCSMLEFDIRDVAARTVGKTTLPDCGPCEISTVFLGLDHRIGDGPPLVFETMVFGGDLEGYQERYSTWEEAAAGHARWVEKCEFERFMKLETTNGT